MLPPLFMTQIRQRKQHHRQRHERAAAVERALALCGSSAHRQHNAARFRAARPSLHELQFVELLPDVVVQSRASRGVVVGSDGAVCDTEVVVQRPWDVFAGPNGVPWSPAVPGSALLATR